MAKDTLRSGQLVTTFGPGSLIDLPDTAVILSGLDDWNYKNGEIPYIEEPRLLNALKRQLPNNPPKAFRSPPPAADNNTTEFDPNVVAWEFPEWFVVQKSENLKQGGKKRRMVHKSQLDGRKFRDDAGKLQSVVPIRFVRSCKKGHVDDIDWKAFVHETDDCKCLRPMWMEERGTSGTLADTWIVCGCEKERSMAQAARDKSSSLGFCTGRRPWLGAVSKESCSEHAKLLVRSASNAYFPQIASVISIPDGGGELVELVGKLWEKGLKTTQDNVPVPVLRNIPAIGDAIKSYTDDQVTEAIKSFLSGPSEDERPVKEVEFEVFSNVVSECGHDVPHGDFYARAMPEDQWKKDAPWMNAFDKIVLVHRLREVIAQIGFTRFESASQQLDGELDLDVEPSPLSRNQDWLPASENRGEGIFLKFDQEVIQEWAHSKKPLERGGILEAGFASKYEECDNKSFFGMPFYMIHSFSHMLMTQISLECGYPASSIRERIYAMKNGCGILIYTGSSDAQGTLGGLIQVGRDIKDIIRRALISAELCSNDPVCSHEEPNPDTQRELLGSACHGCLLVAETSCEWCNSFLDRALVVKTMSRSGSEFFKHYGF